MRWGRGRGGVTALSRPLLLISRRYFRHSEWRVRVSEQQGHQKPRKDFIHIHFGGRKRSRSQNAPTEELTLPTRRSSLHQCEKEDQAQKRRDEKEAIIIDLLMFHLLAAEYTSENRIAS